MSSWKPLTANTAISNGNGSASTSNSVCNGEAQCSNSTNDDLQEVTVVETVKKPVMPTHFYRNQMAVTIAKLKAEVLDARRERDVAWNALRKLPAYINDFRYNLHRNRQHLDEQIEFICGEFRFYLTEVVRNAGEANQTMKASKAKMAALAKRYDIQMSDNDMRLERSTQDLKDLSDRLDAEVRRGDLLQRDLFLVETDLHDKLYLGTKATCAQCKARERVRVVLADQVVEKSDENDRLKKQIEDLHKQLASKDRIAHMLTKTNQQLSFDNRIKSVELDKEVQYAVKKHEAKLRAAGRLLDEGPVPGASATDPLGLSNIEPDAVDGFFNSRPNNNNKDGKCAHCGRDESGTVNGDVKPKVDYSKYKIKKKGDSKSDSADTSMDEQKPDSDTVICAWTRLRQTTYDAYHTSDASQQQQAQQSHPLSSSTPYQTTPPDMTPGSNKSMPMPVKRRNSNTPNESPAQKQRKSERDPSDTPGDEDSQKPLERIPIDQPNFVELQENIDWCWQQIDGFQNMLQWYRQELKNTIDSRNFFADRSEEDIERVDELLEKLTDSLVAQQRQTSENNVLERRCTDLQAVIDTRNAELEHVRQQMSVLTRTVSAYLNGRQHQQGPQSRGY